MNPQSDTLTSTSETFGTDRIDPADLEICLRVLDQAAELHAEIGRAHV